MQKIPSIFDCFTFYRPCACAVCQSQFMKSIIASTHFRLSIFVFFTPCNFFFYFRLLYFLKTTYMCSVTQPFMKIIMASTYFLFPIFVFFTPCNFFFYFRLLHFIDHVDHACSVTQLFMKIIMVFTYFHFFYFRLLHFKDHMHVQCTTTIHEDDNGFYTFSFSMNQN